jgi:hypothetical protein
LRILAAMAIVENKNFSNSAVAVAEKTITLLESFETEVLADFSTLSRS